MHKDLTLAQAMRNGAARYPAGILNLAELRGGQLRVCALGAVYVATFDRLPLSSWPCDIGGFYRELQEVYPELVQVVQPCPFCGFVGKLGWLIAHLNDVEQRSREAIADWHDTIVLELPARAPVELLAEAAG